MRDWAIGDWRLEIGDDGAISNLQSPISNLRTYIRTCAPPLPSCPPITRWTLCAAEFEAYTPYLYSSYESRAKPRPPTAPRSSSWAAGRTASARASSSTTAAATPAFALHDLGYETIMVNCNPETVSTDYDTSDRLYFEPLTLEDVLNMWSGRGREGQLARLMVSNCPIHKQSPRPSWASSSNSAGRRRSTWPQRCRPRACRSWAPRPTPSTWPKIATASARCWRSWTSQRLRTVRRARGGGGGGGRADRLSGGGAPLLRAGRAGHGDRGRRGGPAPLHGRGGERRRRSAPC
jgi:hypothetical protein